MSTTHLAVVEQPFDNSQQTQLNVSSFLCNLRSPSAVSPLQLTTSAHRFPPFGFFSAFRSTLARFPSAFFPFRPLHFRSTSSPFRLLDFTVFPFLFFPSLPHSGSSGVRFPLAVPSFSPFCYVWFPIHTPGSKYSAFCWFPFVLPSFAPAAVPLVIGSLHLSVSFPA